MDWSMPFILFWPVRGMSSIRPILFTAFPSCPFEYPEGLVRQISQNGWILALMRLDGIQDSQESAAHSAGAMCPVRIDRDTFEPG